MVSMSDSSCKVGLAARSFILCLEASREMRRAACWFLGRLRYLNTASVMDWSVIAVTFIKAKIVSYNDNLFSVKGGVLGDEIRCWGCFSYNSLILF